MINDRWLQLYDGSGMRKVIGMTMAVLATGALVGTAVAQADPSGEPSLRDQCLLELMSVNGHWEWLSPECQRILENTSPNRV